MKITTNVGSKPCTRCGVVKPITGYGLDKHKRDGRYPMCRACVKERDLKRDAMPERLARQRAKAKLIQYSVPERRAASVIFHNAMARKKLFRWPVCAVPECTVTKVEGHHPDYSQPLDVVWLCRSCHISAHKLITRNDHA